MKAIYKNIALAALALGAVACSQEDDFSPSYLSDPDAVRITAQVGMDDVTGGFTRSNPLGDAEAQAKFNTGDQIAVATETQAPVVYQLGADGWNPVGDAYLKWQTNEMNVTAYYPVGKNNASATTFTVPTEYADLAALADADYMIYSGTQTKGDDKAINLTMERKMVRIVVDEISFNDQFATGYSVTGIKVHSNTKGYILYDGYDEGLPEGGYIAVAALQQGGDFYALLAPTSKESDETFLTVTVTNNTNSEEVHTLTVKGIPGTIAGNSYNYSLTVGKDKVSIASVSVADWKTGEIIGGVAEEIIPNTFDATAMTVEQLNAAVTKALEYGHTAITVKLAENADATMFSAITAALAADGITDGSIDLTISGAKTVPEYGFFDMDDYYENDDKNIAGDKLKTLTLTDVETIEGYAFSACTYLESVSLPQVVTIGEYAFNEYTKGTRLTSLDLPNATTIGNWAFAYSSLLTSVNLPKVVTIGEIAFANCDLRTLVLPEVTTIAYNAFGHNYNLVFCSAPKATTIKTNPWKDCSSLKTLELTAAGDFTISDHSFYDTPTGQINLVLNKDKESQVTQNADGTATWKPSGIYGTFKSITFKE